MLMMKKPKNLEFEPCTQKMCSLLPWYTEFPVYFDLNLNENNTSCSNFTLKSIFPKLSLESFNNRPYNPDLVGILTTKEAKKV
jgi:hypothetical protein